MERKNKAADYLSHPVDLRNHIKLKPFRRKFGSDGFMFCMGWAEVLAAQEGWEIEYDHFLSEDMSEDFGIDHDLYLEIMKFALEKGWLIEEEKDESKYIRSKFVETVMLERLNKKRAYNRDYQNSKRETKDEPEVTPAEDHGEGPMG